LLFIKYFFLFISTFLTLNKLFYSCSTPLFKKEKKTSKETLNDEKKNILVYSLFFLSLKISGIDSLVSAYGSTRLDC
jgi:hypothetical protein